MKNKNGKNDIKKIEEQIAQSRRKKGDARLQVSRVGSQGEDVEPEPAPDEGGDVTPVKPE